MIYAFDSNIISYILNDNINIIKRYDKEYDDGADFVIPPIVYYEVKRGLEDKNAVSKLKAFEILCAEFDAGEINIYDLDEAVKIYVDLKKQGKLIEDADILIAAYCIANDYILITNNSAHFKRIQNLNYIEWEN